MLFILFIFLTAFLMEGLGSYISVIGLASLFASDPVILAMAVTLDVAKIASVSFLYQYWEDLKGVMKSYMTIAVLVLVTITSAGAFGYLSGAFQKAIQPNREVSLRVDALKREQTSLETEKKQLIDRREKISQQIAQLPPEYVRGRSRLISSFKPESDRIDNRIVTISKRTDELHSEILKVESENIDREVHVGPISYVAKILDVSMEEASKWIILTIVLVFDPLAIMLVLAGNFLIKRRKIPEAPAREEKSSKPRSKKTATVKTQAKIPEEVLSSSLDSIDVSLPARFLQPGIKTPSLIRDAYK